jgi:hypothetical protein
VSAVPLNTRAALLRGIESQDLKVVADHQGGRELGA